MLTCTFSVTSYNEGGYDAFVGAGAGAQSTELVAVYDPSDTGTQPVSISAMHLYHHHYYNNNYY